MTGGSDTAVQEVWKVHMADTAHVLSRFRALDTMFLIQPNPFFNHAAVLATWPASLQDLNLVIFTPVKVLTLGLDATWMLQRVSRV